MKITNIDRTFKFSDKRPGSEEDDPRMVFEVLETSVSQFLDVFGSTVLQCEKDVVDQHRLVCEISHRKNSSSYGSCKSQSHDRTVFDVAIRSPLDDMSDSRGRAANVTRYKFVRRYHHESARLLPLC